MQTTITTVEDSTVTNSSVAESNVFGARVDTLLDNTVPGDALNDLPSRLQQNLQKFWKTMLTCFVQ